jgi:hypothetical protein
MSQRRPARRRVKPESPQGLDEGQERGASTHSLSVSPKLSRLPSRLLTTADSCFRSERVAEQQRIPDAPVGDFAAVSAKPLAPAFRAKRASVGALLHSLTVDYMLLGDGCPRSRSYARTWRRSSRDRDRAPASRG